MRASKPFRSIKEANQLAEKNIALARRFITYQKSRNCPLSDDIIRDCAMDGLVRGTRKWNPSRGAVSTICWIAMISAIRQELRKLNTVKRSVKTQQIMDQYVIPEKPPASTHSDRIDAKMLVDVGFKALTDVERFVLHQRFVMGSTLEAVGQVIGLTRGRIHQIQVESIRKSRQRIEEMVKEEV